MQTLDDTEGLLKEVDSVIKFLPAGEFSQALKSALHDYRRNHIPMRLFYLLMLKQYPVSIKEFIYSKKYLGMGDTMFPYLVPELEDLNNPGGDRLGLKHYEAIYTGGIGVGKALCLDTPIPTSYGFKKMGNLAEGDTVYDQAGVPCKVVKAHDVLYGRECYKVTFSDGSDIVCDSEHLWATQTRNERRSSARTSEFKFTVRTTQQIKDTLLHTDGKHVNHSIPVSQAYHGRTFDLPINPYLLGVWLGDGHTNTGKVSTSDPEILTSFENSGFNIRHIANYDYQVYGLRTCLGAMGMLGPKRLPSNYRSWDKHQRLSLLQGLMDSDGTCDKKGSCIFTNTNKQLAEGVYSLACGLGVIPTLRQNNKKLNGVEFDAWDVTFTAYKDLPVFRLPRKFNRQSSRGAQVSRHTNRYITSVQPHESVPVRCITVDSPNRLYQAGVQCVATHNTHQALITTCYQLYILSCYRDPHKAFGQDKSAEILFILQSLNGGIATDVDYKRFRAMVEHSPYFNEKFRYRKDLESRLVFSNRIEVKPVHGEVTATIGQNVYGGCIDEVNFMPVIKNTTKTRDNSEFDQAKELYNTIESRRASRFADMGVLPGIFCLMSSQNYPGQFTDVKYEESRKDPGIWFFDKTLWEVKGWHEFPGPRFKVFIGDLTRKPRILAPGEEQNSRDAEMTVEVPGIFRQKFDRDIYNGIREYAGRATLAKTPYITDVEAIDTIFKKKPDSIFSRDNVDFVKTQLQVLPKRFINPDLPRYVHVDLGLTSDSAGMAIGHVPRFVAVQDEGITYQMPHIHIDGLLSVAPPDNDEINFAKIRKVITTLHQLGLNIKWISFDSYQSADSMQIFRGMGFTTGRVSLDDKNQDLYDWCKQAVLHRRVTAPESELLQTELIQLERIDGKVDHPMHGSKDLSDAFAGVCYGLSVQRENWSLHGVTPDQRLLERIQRISIYKEGEQHG